jgi:hypothetical protein
MISLNSPPMSIWLGYDSKETTAFAVAKYSIRKFDRYIPIKGLVLEHLQQEGLYYRQWEWRLDPDGVKRRYDIISNAPMSTEFSISRFLVPALAKTGLALFADSDIILRHNINRLFALADPSKAVMCVKHTYEQSSGFKKDKQIQTIYPRKNWSSVMLFNCDHPSNRKLTIEYVNTCTGKELHRFNWLQDEEIGDLPFEWNYCVGLSKINAEPALVHFTEGLPDVPGYEEQEYADEWKSMRPYAVGAA